MHEGMPKNALARVKELMAAIKQDVAEKGADEFIAKYNTDPKRRPHIMQSIRWDKVQEAVKKASASSQRDPLFCIDCGVSLWINGRYAYVIPNGEEFTRKGIKYPKWVEEYAYWDNSDPPEHIPYKQWKMRGKAWDRVCLDRWNDLRLWHDVVSFRPGETTASIVKFESMLFPNRWK